MKKELIEFQKYLRLPGVDNMRSDEVRAINFIQINSQATNESENVIDNEKSKEVCDCTQSDSEDVYGNKWCSKCFKMYLIKQTD